MASSTVTSDENLAESVRIYPVLHDKSCAVFREKLKKQLARTDVAKEVGLENDIIRRKISYKLYKLWKLEHIYD